MNSLQDLNNWASTTITVNDNRSPNVVFDRITSINYKIDVNFIDEATPPDHVVPVGFNIVEVIDPAVSAPEYVIDVSASPGADVSWANLPAGVAVSTPITGRYILSGINSAAIWDQIKNPTITLDQTYQGTFTYNPTVRWNSGSVTKSWTVEVSADNVTFLSLTRSDDTYIPNSLNLITGGPLITDVNFDGSGNYVMTVVPINLDSVETISSRGVSTWPVVSSTAPLTSGVVSARTNSDLSFFAFGDQFLENGFVYVYTRSGDNLTLQQAITSGPAPSGADPSFGSTFEANSAFDRLVIIAHNDDFGGAAYVYNRTGTTWTLFRRIQNPQSKTFRNCAISADGETIAIQAESGSASIASNVLVYTKTPTSYTLSATFTGVRREFGFRDPRAKANKIQFSPDGLTLFVIDATEAVAGFTSAGAIYVFKKTAGTWAFVTKLVSPAPYAFSDFGELVNVVSNTQIIAYETLSGQNVNSSASERNAYKFEFNGDTWVLIDTEFYESKLHIPFRIFSTTADGVYSTSLGDFAVAKYRNGEWKGYFSIPLRVGAEISADGNYLISYRNISGNTLQVHKKLEDDTAIRSFDPETKTMTINGTRSFINEEIDTITMTPEDNFEDTIVLNYTVVTPRSDTDSRTQNITKQ